MECHCSGKRARAWLIELSISSRREKRRQQSEKKYSVAHPCAAHRPHACGQCADASHVEHPGSAQRSADSGDERDGDRHSESGGSRSCPV